MGKKANQSQSSTFVEFDYTINAWVKTTVLGTLEVTMATYLKDYLDLHFYLPALITRYCLNRCQLPGFSFFFSDVSLQLFQNIKAIKTGVIGVVFWYNASKFHTASVFVLVKSELYKDKVYSCAVLTTAVAYSIAGVY